MQKRDPLRAASRAVCRRIHKDFAPDERCTPSEEGECAYCREIAAAAVRAWNEESMTR